jgi:hypothetical protein
VEVARGQRVLTGNNTNVGEVIFIMDKSLITSRKMRVGFMMLISIYNSRSGNVFEIFRCNVGVVLIQLENRRDTFPDSTTRCSRIHIATECDNC